MSLPTQYQEYIHLSRYARYDDEKGRRETWDETVTRYCTFFKEKFPDLFPYDLIHRAILELDVMPSMRALMCAGPALERDNVAGYNCSYLPMDNIRSFDEGLYILMCGTGEGFSVEESNVKRLPTISDELRESSTTIIVEDSKVGWASGFRQLVSLLYAGTIPKWDLSRIRPAGSRLRTFGGRASGPEPLDALFRFASDTFKSRAGKKLSTINVHDLCGKIADCVVVGGVRRSALISLSDLSDSRLRNAKTGQWWDNNPQRALANNSAVYDVRPDFQTFLTENTRIIGHSFLKNVQCTSEVHCTWREIVVFSVENP
jgi:ribonucleoside-diphosphate reductase alpha chain